MSGGPSAASSNDLVRWLRGLSLPAWARVGVAALMSVVVAGAASVLVYGLVTGNSNQISSAIALLTLAVPVILTVLALAVGQSSDRRLRALTRRVLEEEIPAAIMENVDTAGRREIQVKPTIRGCCADYIVRRGDAESEVRLDLRVELNVWKANVCFWVDVSADDLHEDSPRISAFRHVVAGAYREDYELNPTPGVRSHGVGRRGMLFVKALPEDFLLEPSRRLYFTQDLSFFVNGMLDTCAEGPAAPAG